MKNKIKSLMFAVIMVLSIIPFAAADTPGTGTGIGINIDPVDALPRIWMDPDSRIVLRNPADGSGELIERVNNYAFEGEQIIWDVLVLDANGIEKINEVYVSVGDVQGSGEDIEANCDASSSYGDGSDITTFNAFVGQNPLTTLDADTMRVYTCILTVENGDPITGMYGEFWVVGNVLDIDGNLASFDENEFWFFNPVIALDINGNVNFADVIPGQMSYSETLTVTNDADEGSGVLLDMQISGTDFYDSSSSGAKCPTTNRLKLNNGGTAPVYDNEGTTDPAAAYVRGAQSNCDASGDIGIEGIDGSTGVDSLCYFASNGNYDTSNDATRRDNEGYVGISYATSDDDNRDPVISSTDVADRVTLGTGKSFFAGNVLSPGSDLSFTLRLYLPMPCNGGFDNGQIYFWGEAI